LKGPRIDRDRRFWIANSRVIVDGTSRAQCLRGGRMITRILVPTDFSEPAEAALTYARTIARGLGATLHVLHVIEPTSPAAEAELIRAAKVKLARRILPSDKVRFSATREIAAGDPVETIVQSAMERKIDLIVMGIGHVADAVTRNAPCVVMNVPADGRQRIPIEERVPVRATA
jgi:nucleotide-binding universal stress UspA family protein